MQQERVFWKVSKMKHRGKKDWEKKGTKYQWFKETSESYTYMWVKSAKQKRMIEEIFEETTAVLKIWWKK